MTPTTLSDLDYELEAESGAGLQALRCPGNVSERVSGFPRYQQSVRSLPLAEQAKVTRLARLIVKSFTRGCAPITRVLFVGHADRDRQRGPAFEKSISIERARELRIALTKAVHDLSRMQRVAPSAPSVSSIRWEHRGRGASRLLVPNPTTEQQRARNRRVEIFLSTGAPTPQGWDHAVRENRRYARSLGWQAYGSAIMRFLGFITVIPSESVFASAVARWQSGRNLAPSGIIGPQTLARIRAALQSLKSFAGDDTRLRESSQEIPPDPAVLRQLQREFQYEAGDEADKFVTEQVFGFPQGHKHLTELAASGLPISAADLDALKEGVARVDDLTKAFDASEQHRHTLRRNKCQPVRDALSEVRNHLMRLHSLALTAPLRRTQFELFGEALHLIQDSYSTAHTERVWGGPGSIHPILFIRFFGFQGSCTFPIEHRVVPPPDPRDTIKAGGTLTPFAKESVSASREYLEMALRHLRSRGSPTIARELRAFMDRHLLLSPSHTPTTFCYPTCPDPAAICRCP
jgi:hypothetical protein